MTLLGVLEDDEYLPEYGTVVIRDDHRTADGLPPLPNDLLGELATSALSGTVATAGDGWLHGMAGDPYQAVRLEAHDAEPAIVLAEWDDVMETPFHSRTGAVRLGYLTGGEFDDTLDLRHRGLFGVRVARRAAEPGEQGDVWLFQFWPTDEPGLPRWVRRTRPAVTRADPGWRQVLGYHVQEVGWFAAGFGMPRPDSWLDEPLPGDAPDPSVCAQLGVPRPVTRRDAIPLLVAAGVLVPDGDGHRLAEHPPMATERLDLPAEQARSIELSATREQYIWLASDLVSVAAWGDPAPVDGLAERLLVTPAEETVLLAFAVSDKLVEVDGGVRALPRPVPPQPRVVAVPAPIRATSPETSPGGPPRAGIISGNGDVVVWRGDEPVVLARVPDEHRYRAYETVSGIVVASSGGPALLVHPDGTAERLPVDLGWNLVRSVDGRFLAGIEHHVGRHSWDQPHLLDLVTGEVASLPRTPELTRAAIAVHDGAFYYAADGHAYRWLPGTEPVALDVRQIDPLSGTTLRPVRDGFVVRRPGGADVPAPAGRPYELAPGGERLYAFGYQPPSAWLLDVGATDPVEHPLPEGCDTSTSIPACPIWETPDTLLFHHRHGGNRLVRWHVPTDRFEDVDLGPIAGYRPFAVRPVLTG
jgi:hypothetical protein